MRLGIFAKTFPRPTLAAAFEAVVEHGLDVIQFNFATAGLAPMPAAVPPGLPEFIRAEAAARSIEIAALSGTFNMIHPDPAVVARGLASLGALAEAARPMGVGLITLCTGTRDPDNMWRRDPDNDSDAAWQALLGAMEQALAIAVRHQVTLGVETEPGNVINSARKCRRLLDEFASPWLKVIFDPANLVGADLSRDPGDLLTEALDLLGPDVVIGHAKECGPNGEVLTPGRGIVPWSLVISGLSAQPHSDAIPLIIHGIDESDVGQAVAFLRARIDEAA
jgi:sugar phosphate isomerase/epimerase